MKSALCLILAALALAVIACEGLVPTPTPGSATPPPISTPVSTSTPPPKSTPPPIPADALSIVRSAEENLRAVPSFHIVILAEQSGRETTIEADIVPPDRGRFVMFLPVDLTTNLEMESLLIGTTQYILYPNFQAWFNVGEADLSRSNLQSFPYDLAGFREAVESFELLGEGVIDGMEAYRLTGTGTEELRQTVGFREGVGVPEVELWISRADLLPLRIETTIEDPEASLVFIYTDYGADVDVSVPDNVIDIGWMNELMEGTLSPDELGQVVRALPVAGQQCIEAEIGADVYREVIAGDSEDGSLVMSAFIDCEGEIFPAGDGP